MQVAEIITTQVQNLKNLAKNRIKRIQVIKFCTGSTRAKAL